MGLVKRRKTIKTDKYVMRGVHYYSVKKDRLYTLGYGWSYLKGDWWYENDASTAKFFDIRKETHDNHTRYGVYVGRLGLVFIKSTQKE